MVMALLKVTSMIHLSITQLFKLARICMSTDLDLMLLKRNGVKKLSALKTDLEKSLSLMPDTSENILRSVDLR
jgi:hypothetical protein